MVRQPQSRLDVPERATLFLKELRTRFGTVEDYQADVGVSGRTLAAIRVNHLQE